MTSREGEERGCGVLSARDGLGLGCTRWKQLEGLVGVLGTALWSQSRGVVAELGRVLCQRPDARVQSACNVFVSRPEGSGGRACWARVARCWGFDAVLGDVHCAGKSVCTPRNGYAALGAQSVHGRGQSAG
jgi:hypothetical protein